MRGERIEMKRNSVMRLILLALVIALLATTFSACSLIDGFFDGYKPPTPTVTEVLPIHRDGLILVGDGEYTALVGQEFILDTMLNDNAPEQVTYRWYVTVDGQKHQVGEEKVLKYTFETYKVGKYEFSVTANNVASTESIVVSVEYPTNLTNLQITSSTHGIYDGVVQESADKIEEVQFAVSWDECAVPENGEVSIAWAVGNGAIIATDKEFSYTPTSVGTYIINAVVTYNGNVNHLSVKIVVIEGYSAVSTATLIIEDGADPIGSGVETQYYQEVYSENRDAITVSLSTTPIGETDYDAPVTWIVRDRDGERVLDEDGRQVVFVPAYGETMVKAVVDNVESEHIIIFALTSADYQQNEKYIKDVFLWVDGVENAYLTDQTDVDRFLQYMFSTRKVALNASDVDNVFPFTMASNFKFMEVDSERNAVLQHAMSTIDESGRISINTGAKQNSSTGEIFDYVLFITEAARFMTPSQNYSPATVVTQDTTAILHYTELEESEKRTTLPIDDNPVYTDAITNSQMLFRVIGWGYKPYFDGSAESQKMKALYEKIRQVAIDYIADDMTDYEKTLIIYEWIAQTVDYDYAVADADLDVDNFESLTYNAFSLEGVFNDADGEGYGQAVCDGRAKAFVALCGVEDIKAVRVTGESQTDKSAQRERHAWNKVLIDVNGDGKKEWFMCDTTWSDRSSSVDRIERVNKQYFLVTDDYIKDTHFADPNCYNPACTTTFDYYANTVVENGNNDFDLYIEDDNSIFGNNELENAVKYAKDNGKMLEIKVSTKVCYSASSLNQKIKAYTFTNKFEIYTIATHSGYNIFIIVFE